MTRQEIINALKSGATVCCGTSRTEVVIGGHMDRFAVCAVDMITGNSFLVDTPSKFKQCFIKVGGVGNDF